MQIGVVKRLAQHRIRVMQRGVWLLGMVLGMGCLLSSCVKYERLLKGTDTRAQYAAAKDFYQQEKYGKAKPLFEKVAPMSRATRIGDTVFYMLSVCYLKEKDYSLAGYSFDRFTQEYPSSAFLEPAMFFSAYCHYRSSPRVDLDQENTRRAIMALELFREKYPQSPCIDKVGDYLKEMYGKLIEREYLQARLYYDREQYRAAVVAFKGSLERYPVSPYREEQMFLIVKSSYLLAKNSIVAKQRERYQQTVDHYLSFVSEYSESKYSQQARKYYDLSQAYLEAVEP